MTKAMFHPMHSKFHTINMQAYKYENHMIYRPSEKPIITAQIEMASGHGSLLLHAAYW